MSRPVSAAGAPATRAAHPLRSPGLVVLGLAGAAVAVLVIWNPTVLPGFDPAPSLAGRSAIAAGIGSVALLAALSTPEVRR